VAKPPSPLVGFNNNVKHKGRIFHVQTEDSGIKRPHIVTHLFADGGRILKSTRTDYSEHLGRKDMHTVVRRMMKEQHKAMFIALRDGQLDDVINLNCGPTAAEAPPADVTPIPRSTPSKRKSRPPPTLPDMPLAEALAIPTGEADVDPSQRRAPSPTLTDLVLADLETAKSRPAASVRALTQNGGKPIQKGTPVLGTPAMTGTVGTAARYAAPRPAAIFSPPAAQAEPNPSLFGRPSISEQSLDEVILSYLAEDLDESPEE
jgi:hypothetical protein